MGTIYFYSMGGQGEAITLFSLPSPAEYFSFFEGGGGGDASSFSPDLLPNCSPRRIFRFSRTFSMGWGVLAGFVLFPSCLLDSRRIFYLVERGERGAIVLYTSLIIPKLPKRPVSLRSHLLHTPSTIRGEPSYHDRV